MRLVNQSLKEYLPEVMAAYKVEIRNDSRMDGLFDLRSKISKMIGNVSSAVEKKNKDFDLRARIDRVAVSIKNTALREWKKTIQKTFGLEVDDKHYKDELYINAIKEWDDAVEARMKGMPEELLQKIREIIETGYEKGDSPTIIKVRVQNTINAMKRKAALNAQAHVSILNSECTKTNQKDAGVEKYMWKSMRDSKVRPCHRELDGKVLSWDDPPEMWYDTKSRGRVYTGRHCGPGEDYNCRCTAVPIFPKETLNIPFAPKQKEGVLVGASPNT